MPRGLFLVGLVLAVGCSSGPKHAADRCTAVNAQAKAYNKTWAKYFASVQSVDGGQDCTPIQVDPGCRARTLEANLVLAYPNCFIPSDVAFAHTYLNR